MDNTLIPWLLDGAVLLILIVCIAKAWADGFAKSLVDLVAKLAALLCAWFVCTPVAQFIFDRFLREGVTTLLRGKVADLLDPAALEATLSGVLAQLPPALTGAVESFGAKDLGAMAGAMGSASSEELLSFLAKTVVEPAIVGLLKIGVFLIVFIVVCLLAGMLANALKLINKVPILGVLNRALGAVLGALKGALFCAVFALALTLVAAGLPGLIDGLDTQALEKTHLVAPISQMARDALGLGGQK